MTDDRGGSQILLWNLKAPELPQVAVDLSDRWGSELSFSATGRWLVTETKTGFVVIDVEEGRKPTVLTLPPPITGRFGGAYAFSPDDTLFAVGYQTEKRSLVLLWDLASGTRRGAIANVSPQNLSFSPDGSLLAAGDGFGVVRFLRVDGGQEQWRQTMPEFPHYRFLHWHKDGKRLFTENVGMESLALWEPVWDHAEDITPHSRAVSLVTAAKDSERARDAAEDKPVEVGSDGERLWGLSPGGRFAATVPPGTRLYTYLGVDVSSIALWDLARKERVGSLDPGGEYVIIRRPTFSPDGRWLFSPDGSMLLKSPGKGYLWSVPDGRKHVTIAGTSDIWACAFSADSQFFAAGHSDGTIELWDVEGGQLLCRWKRYPGYVRVLAFTGDGSGLVIAQDDAPDRVLDLNALRRQLAEVGLDW
jgi:WD40 repeat protein